MHQRLKVKGEEVKGFCRVLGLSGAGKGGRNSS